MPPVLSILSFVIACVVAMYALFTKANRDAQGSAIWDIACVYTVTWIVAGTFLGWKVATSCERRLREHDQ
jgi:hypothetical protein